MQATRPAPRQINKTIDEVNVRSSFILSGIFKKLYMMPIQTKGKQISKTSQTEDIGKR